MTRKEGCLGQARQGARAEAHGARRRGPAPTPRDPGARPQLARVQWQVGDILAKKPLAKQPHAASGCLRLIARWGGCLGRYGEGEPGAKTL